MFTSFFLGGRGISQSVNHHWLLVWRQTCMFHILFKSLIIYYGTFYLGTVKILFLNDSLKLRSYQSDVKLLWLLLPVCWRERDLWLLSNEKVRKASNYSKNRFSICIHWTVTAVRINQLGLENKEVRITWWLFLFWHLKHFLKLHSSLAKHSRIYQKWNENLRAFLTISNYNVGIGDYNIL